MKSDPEIIHHAQAIAALAADVARTHFRGALGVEFKADESPVTQADRAVEAAVRTYLAEHAPGHGIFGEEEGIDEGDGQHLWVIDPIDGTRSFLSGHPLFGFLLAYLENGASRLGVIGMPALGETFIGIRGRGASMNGKPIGVSGCRDLDQAIMYINEGERIIDAAPEVFAALLKVGQTRRFAYDCYPHALLAAGHVDVVVDYGLEPYDHLPVAAVIEAAGGIMTDWDGQAMTLQSDGRTISAATPELHAALLNLVRG